MSISIILFLTLVRKSTYFVKFYLGDCDAQTYTYLWVHIQVSVHMHFYPQTQHIVSALNSLF